MTVLPSPARVTDAAQPAASGGRRWRYALLAITTASSAAIIGLYRHSPVTVAVVLVATAGCASLAVLERRSPRLGPKAVVAAIALVFAVALSLAPKTSNDLWSYTMYGRIVSVYGHSPYTHLPYEFRTDPFYKRISPIWQHRGSVYGPVFVGYATVGTFLAGNSVLADRLFFQLSAALAAAAALWVLWRRTRSVSALIWLGMCPLMGPIIVNGGHNDIAIGLAILLAAILAGEQDRGWLAGILIGLASLIKFTSFLALIGLVIWAWRRGKRRLAATTVGGAALTVFLVYLPFLGGATKVLSGADKTLTYASPWNWLGAILIGHDAGRNVPHPLHITPTLYGIFYTSVVGVIVLTLVVGWYVSRGRRLQASMGATTAAYTVGAEYSFPWYAFWALPVLADRDPTPLAWAVWAQAIVMLAALKLPTHPSTSIVDTIMGGIIQYAAPVVVLVFFIVAGTRWALRPPNTADI
ncbi:MAG TPA: glycosyltransferase 87 family protein [Acidimicrobiia bacterium]|nr:glycosyltransferase 87 family protein [Acidimicrobiia bacterium]